MDKDTKKTILYFLEKGDRLTALVAFFIWLMGTGAFSVFGKWLLVKFMSLSTDAATITVLNIVCSGVVIICMWFMFFYNIKKLKHRINEVDTEISRYRAILDVTDESLKNHIIFKTFLDFINISLPEIRGNLKKYPISKQYNALTLAKIKILFFQYKTIDFLKRSDFTTSNEVIQHLMSLIPVYNKIAEMAGVSKCFILKFEDEVHSEMKYIAIQEIAASKDNTITRNQWISKILYGLRLAFLTLDKNIETLCKLNSSFEKQITEDYEKITPIDLDLITENWVKEKEKEVLKILPE